MEVTPWTCKNKKRSEIRTTACNALPNSNLWQSLVQHRHRRSSVSPAVLLVESSNLRFGIRLRNRYRILDGLFLCSTPQHRSIPLSCLPWPYTKSTLDTIPRHSDTHPLCLLRTLHDYEIHRHVSLAPAQHKSPRRSQILRTGFPCYSPCDWRFGTVYRRDLC